MDDPLQDTPEQLEIGIPENRYDVQRDIRRRAKRLRRMAE